MAKAFELGLVAWSPLAGGVLSGKYNQTETPAEDSRYSAEMMQGFLPEKERQARVVQALHEISGKTGRSLAQVALAWLRYRAIPVIPIIGARKLTQLHDNLESLSLTLTPEQVKALDEASHIQLGFPHDF